MERGNSRPSRGCYQDLKELLSDYRLRAIKVGGCQFGVAVTYMHMAITQVETIWTEVSTSRHHFSDPYIFGMYFWVVLNVILALLQIYSTTLILRAARQGAEKLQAEWFCDYARYINWCLVFYEIIVFALNYEAHLIEVFVEMMLYRIWFRHDMIKYRDNVLT